MSYSRNRDRDHHGERDHLERGHEQERETKVILVFMRHGKKEASNDKSNAELLLTEEGRQQAHDKGEKINPQIDVSVGVGSPRKRTKETALLVMLANEEKIDPKKTSLEKIEEAIARELRVGGKVYEDQRLDFNLNGPIGEEMGEAFKRGEYIQYLIQESDRRAIELGDKISSTYTRQAGNIAEVIDRYVAVGDNFHRLASQTDKYEEFGNQLERYLATHLGVVESFVAKVLEKTEGEEKRDEFIRSVGSGFKETQGMRVEIINKGTEQEIIITYPLGDKEEKIKVSKELLDEIIKERQEFEEKIDRSMDANAD